MGISQQIGASSAIKAGVCTSSTRPASPYEGQVIYETDTDLTYVWSGSAWISPSFVSTALTGTPTAPTAAAGTNTTQIATTAFANQSGGLVYITSGSLSSSATNFVGCFSSTYDNYRIVVQTIKASGNADIFIRLLHGSTPLANGSYFYTDHGYYNNGTSIVQVSSGLGTSIYTGVALYNTGIQASLVFDVMTPNLVKNTIFMGQSVSYNSQWLSKTFTGLQQDDESFDGIRFATLNSETMTGTVTIYGYRK